MCFMQVTFDDGSKAHLTNELTVDQTSPKPTVKFDEAKPDKKYLLVMINPNGTKDGKEKPHWIVPNIPGSR